MDKGKFAETMLRTAFIIIMTVLFFFVASVSLNGGLQSTFANENDTGKEANVEKIPIFVYHRFCTEDDYQQLDKYKSLYVTEEMLDQQMAFLRDNGYRTIDMQEFYDWYTGKIKLPPKTVMITIDDGFYSAVKYALPIFEKYDIKSTLFVIGERVSETTDMTDGEENRHSIGKDIIASLKEEHPNFGIQSHSWSMHKYAENTEVGRVINYSAKQCFDDLRKQSETFGFEYMAYPFGTYTDRLTKALEKEGSIKMAFTYGHNKYASRSQNRYKIERIKINSTKPFDSFTRWLNDSEPYISSLQSDFTDENNTSVNNTLTFCSAEGEEYIIMRRTLFSSWKEVDRVTGERIKTKWTDENVKSEKSYKYTIKRIVGDKNGRAVCTPFNKEGVKTLNKYVIPKVSYTNMEAQISFIRRVRVSGYEIYRKCGDSEYELLKYKNQRKRPFITFSDVYVNSCKKGAAKERITFKNFVDPTENDFVYSVRACINNEDGSIVRGPMLLDGDYKINSPVVVSVRKKDAGMADIIFSTVPNADRYLLYSGIYSDDKDIKWKEVGEAFGTGDKATITAEAEVGDEDNCFAVKAEFVKNGKVVYSEMDETYTTAFRKFSGKKVLVIGASSSYGCPYKSEDKRFIFSYSYRMSELLGAEMTNTSVPGAVYSESGRRAHIVSGVVDKIEKGMEIDKGIYPQDVLDRNFNKYDLSDFDIIIVAAGGNDYNINLAPGTANSKDRKTFAGGVNAVLEKIQEASLERQLKGDAETIVIMQNTTYSDRRGDFSVRRNRYETKNKAGYTLQDFRDVFAEISEINRKQGMKIYLFESDDYLNKENCPSATTDNLHMTKTTNAAVGRYMAETIYKEGIINH